MKTGIIYKYTSPENKVYIGQTYNEVQRRSQFLSKRYYGGVKIDTARFKFGVCNFKYEILKKEIFDDYQELKQWLNEWKRFYIDLNDSEKKDIILLLVTI